DLFGGGLGVARIREERAPHPDQSGARALGLLRLQAHRAVAARLHDSLRRAQANAPVDIQTDCMDNAYCLYVKPRDREDGRRLAPIRAHGSAALTTPTRNISKT